VTTIATFTKPEDAHLMRLRLGAAGIEAFVQDEHLVQIYPLYANAFGGVRLQVADEDVSAVRETLVEDPGLPPDADVERCPRCGSPVHEVERFSRWFAFLSLLVIGIPILILRRRKRCVDCLYTWK
jgi:hypothetical protein